MTREIIRDHIPWDDRENTRDRTTIQHTKLDSTGIHDLVDKLQDQVTKLDFELHGIRDEINELEARSLQNVLTKQSKRQ